MRGKEIPTHSWLFRHPFSSLSYGTLSWSISATLLKDSGTASRAWGIPCSQTEICLEADFETLLKDPKSWIEGAGKGWASQAHLSGWSQKTDPFPHRDLPYHTLGIWGLVASFPPWTSVQSRLETVGAEWQCSYPSLLLPLLPRSGNANTFQYPPKANIIRKINQLEEPPKFNTFPIPLTTDFGPL